MDCSNINTWDNMYKLLTMELENPQDCERRILRCGSVLALVINASTEPNSPININQGVLLDKIKKGHLNGKLTEVAYIRVGSINWGILLNRPHYKICEEGCQGNNVCDRSYACAGMFIDYGDCIFLCYTVPKIIPPNKTLCKAAPYVLEISDLVKDKEHAMDKIKMTNVVGVERIEESFELADIILKALQDSQKMIPGPEEKI